MTDKIKCWPGCKAEVIESVTPAYIGKVVVCIRLKRNFRYYRRDGSTYQADAWETSPQLRGFEGNIVPAPDFKLKPIDPDSDNAHHLVDADKPVKETA